MSLWAGTAASEDAFELVLEVGFSEDGDFLGSPFSRAFGIDYYDEGLREAEYFQEPSDRLEVLLDGVSYQNVVLPRLREEGQLSGPVNCVVLLYDQRHDGPTRWSGPDVVLEFFGSARYR
ncbi:MAG: immunity 22 family protein [Myxococcota bacterium]|nr:immunity 22 family protein [Myxococcota bacterium]